MKKQLLSAAIAATSLVSLQAQTTIVNYSTGGTNVSGYTGFFNTADGWNNSGDPLWEGQQGWGGTDTGADSVSQVAGITPSSPANNGSGTLGVFVPALPLNTATPYLERTFTPMSTAVFTNISLNFTAEWALLEFGPTPYDDTFTFDLRNAANTASLLTFTLNPAGAGVGFDYEFTSTGSSTISQFDTTYGALIRMQVDVKGSSYTGSYDLINGVTRAVISSGTLTGGTLAGGAVASDIGALRFGWQLASGDPNDPGTLGTVVNEFTFTSTGDPIPEPGTWAVGALLLSGAAASIYRRRKAAASKAA